MIQYIPFVYFSILSFSLYLKRGFDVSVFITLLYVATSFFSILMFNMGLVEPSKMNPSLVSTIIYCVLISACILPISKLKTGQLEIIINKRMETFVTRMTYVFFFALIVYLILNYEELVRIILFGDFNELRYDALNAEERHASGFIGLIKIIVGLIIHSSVVMIPVFFISIIYLKKGALFNLIIALSSLSSLVSDIIGVSRSGYFYYAIIFGICLVIFWKKLSRKAKAAVTPVICAISIGIGVFFAQVTIDRFENYNSIGGTQGSLVVYAGQPYTNFCFMYDHKPFTSFSTRFILPFTNYVINGYKGGIQREEEMTNETKLECYVFMTFLGSFVMDCNQVMPFIYVIIFVLLVNLCIKNKHGTNVSFFLFICIFLLLLVPAVGCISYYYTSPFKNLSLILLLILVRHNRL